MSSELNKFPCITCGQPEYGEFHSLERLISQKELMAYNYNKRGDFNTYRHLVYEIEQLRDDGWRRGWNGHHYQPIDNLMYLELKEKEVNG